MPRKRYGVCPFCGKQALLTRDHAPPSGIFLSPKPNNLITVRTCRACNEGTKLDDEYFRLCLAPAPNPSPAQWQLWNTKIIGSTLTHSPKLRANLVQLMDAVQEQNKRIPLVFNDGTPLTAEQAAHTIGLDKHRIDSVIDKVVRCLYYRFAGSVLPRQIVTDVSMEYPGHYEHQLAEPCGTIGTHREFIFWYDRSSVVLGSYWLLWFYESRLFKAMLCAA
jgi:hypothetical protein